MGWIFNISEATDTYIFIVFLVNKLLGILLIPALILMAFSGEPFVGMVVILSLVLIVVFFLYRYIASYEPVRREIRVSQIHFIIYLLAFEGNSPFTDLQGVIDFFRKKVLNFASR